MSRDRAAILIILSISLVITYNYFHFVERPDIDRRMQLHDSIIRGEARSPYRYRILVPMLTQGMTEALEKVTPLSYRKAWILAYIIYDFAAIFLFLTTLYIFLTKWHAQLPSLAGTLFCCAVLPLSLRDHYFQPWSLLESFLFCAAFLAAWKKNFVQLALITLAASLNRVSGIFVPLIYLASSMRAESIKGKIRELNLKILLRFLALAVVGAGSILLVRYLRGGGEHVYSASQLWDINTSFPYPVYAVLNVILFGGAWWIFFVAGMKEADRFILSLLPVALLYLIPVSIFGIWKEVRLLMPFYPLLISTGLYYFSRIFRSAGPVTE
jgi:hypothetical protein